MAFVSKIMAFVKVYSGGSGGDDDKFLGIPMLSLFLLIRCVFDVLDEEEWLSPAIFLAFHGWNVRGLGNRNTVRALRDTIDKHHPSVVFLIETKQKKMYLEKIRRRNI
ncbi:hypothetical protein V6N11_039972 [Hibiscus sabdariffa]|uniref:Uncharacterized protein n=1 Tax=Hibiscus sabdariffa TaxID=183260 RepID=A0ABR2RG82_9ROSI